MTDLLEKHFAPLRNPSNDSDWLDVRRRARRPWRRAVLVAVVAATVALLVAPAFGVGGRVLDLIQGKPAPPPVQTSFVGGNAARQQRFAFAAAAGLALHDRFSPVVPGETRGVAEVETADGPIYLWVAPTEDGRHCWLVQTGNSAVTPHTLRRTFGTELLNKGMALEQLSKLLGHADTRVTEASYAEMLDETVRAAAMRAWSS
jgi:integrase